MSTAHESVCCAEIGQVWQKVLLSLLRRLPTVPVSMLGMEITPVTVAKDLGIHIDQSLTYNDHITKTASSCLHKLIQINRIKHLLDKKTLILLMNCFICSKLLYCSTVWSNTSRSNIKKLQLVQNFAARIVLGLRKFDHISQGIRSLNWLPVCDRLYLNDAIMILSVFIISSLIIWQKNFYFALKLILEIQDRATI